jgi:hypothetical protein
LLPGVDASELLMFENTVFTALATPGVRFGENAGIFLSACLLGSSLLMLQAVDSTGRVQAGTVLHHTGAYPPAKS